MTTEVEKSVLEVTYLEPSFIYIYKYGKWR